MNVAYVTPYYNGHCDGRFGRFHDWIHTAREMDTPPFEFDVYAFTSSNEDQTLASNPYKILGEATELWGTKWNKPEFIMNAPQIRSALQAKDYDLIHVLVMDTIVLPTVLSLQPDVPLILGPDIAGWSPIRDGMFSHETAIDWVKNRLSYILKNTLAKTTSFNQVIVFSEHHKNILETFSIPTSKIRKVHGGVSGIFSRETEHERNDPLELLYVGDFSAHKGYTIFLEALAGLDASFTARLIGAGDPNHELIHNLGLDSQTVVEGFIPRSKLPKYYMNADLYVNPSIDETAGPNTQLESLASGTPIVATDKLGINEFAPSDASILFSPREVYALRSAIDQAMQEIETLTLGAEKTSDNFHAKNTLEDLSDIYTNILSESH